MRPIRRIFKFFTATRRRKLLSALLVLSGLLVSFRFFFFPAKEVQAADVYLGMDEGYGSSVNDSNQTISAATINGATWQPESMCKSGKCLYFDGTNDWISLGATDLARNASAVTLMAWVRPTSTISSEQGLIQISKNSGTPTALSRAALELVATNKVEAGGRAPDSQSLQVEATANNSISPNTWYHIAAVIDYANDNVNIYLNGILQNSSGTVNFTNTATDNTASSYGSIGAEDDGSGNFFNGFMDEIKIYSSARTAAEVKADFTGETPSRGTSASFGPDQSFLSNGLVGYWKMEEAGDATRADSSGNGNTLTESASDTVAQVAGKFGNAADFELGDTENMSITDASQKGLDLSQTFPISTLF